MRILFIFHSFIQNIKLLLFIFNLKLGVCDAYRVEESRVVSNLPE